MSKGAMNEEFASTIRLAMEKGEQWLTYARQEENFPIVAAGAVCLLLVIIVVVRILMRRATARAMPGYRLRENIEKMRNEAPYKGNRR